MNRPIFSPMSTVADALGRAANALARIADRRRLTDAKVDELDTLKAQHREFWPLRQLSGPAFDTGQDGTRHEACRRAGEATGAAIPLTKLLSIADAVSVAWRRRLPSTTETFCWLCVTSILEDLALICAAGISTPERQQQLRAFRDLQSALSRIVEQQITPTGAAGRSARFQAKTASPAEQAQGARQCAEAAFSAADKRFRGKLATIRAEAAQLRARSR